MGSDTDRLPQLDEEYIETIVLEDSDIMATREMRALINAGNEDSAGDDEAEDDGA